MSMIREFEKSGNRLFKYRSFIPLVLYVFAALAIWLDKDEFVPYQEYWWSLICLGVSAIGMMIRAIAIGYAPRGTSGRNTGKQIADTINTTGLYSVVRHPLYLGNFLMWLGLIIYVGSWEFLIFAVFFFWIYYERIMFAEERFIGGKFGQEFEDWAAKTPAFFPKCSGYVKTGRTLNWRSVMRREYHGFFATILSFAIINFLKHLFYTKEPMLDIEWMIGLGAGLLIYIFVRFVVKATRWLEVKPKN